MSTLQRDSVTDADVDECRSHLLDVVGSIAAVGEHLMAIEVALTVPQHVPAISHAHLRNEVEKLHEHMSFIRESLEELDDIVTAVSLKAAASVEGKAP